MGKETLGRKLGRYAAVLGIGLGGGIALDRGFLQPDRPDYCPEGSSPAEEILNHTHERLQQTGEKAGERIKREVHEISNEVRELTSSPDAGP